MAKFSLRRYDTQARLSVWVSAASVVTLVGMIAVLVRRLTRDDLVIYYGRPTMIAFFLAAMITGGMAVTGLGLGWNSVGQRRNDQQQLSWLGFFIGGGVLVLVTVTCAFFVIRGELVLRG